jgi:hypothetical protein
MSSFADRAVLSASQLDAIRHLELWAQANTGESETTGATDDDDDADVAYSLDPNAALPTDKCWGHPYMTMYHNHGYSWKCFPNKGKAGQQSPLYGYALDGFGVRGYAGSCSSRYSSRYP